MLKIHRQADGIMDCRSSQEPTRTGQCCLCSCALGVSGDFKLGIGDPVRRPRWCLDRSLHPSTWSACYGPHRFLIPTYIQVASFPRTCLEVGNNNTQEDLNLIECLRNP